MSISQMKKQFEEFATYLGRDTTGQDKLKKLKDGFSLLRSQLAASESVSATAAKNSEAMQIRAQKAERELTDAHRENQRLQQIATNLSRDLKIADERIAAAAAAAAESESPEAANEPVTIEERELKSALKQLRTKLKFCPRATRRFRDNSVKERPFVWDRESLAKGWSHDALWTLGAAMAVTVAMNGTVVLETKNRLLDALHQTADPNSDESFGRQLVQWLRKNMLADIDPSEAERYARFQGKTYTDR